MRSIDPVTCTPSKQRKARASWMHIGSFDKQQTAVFQFETFADTLFGSVTWNTKWKSLFLVHSTSTSNVWSAMPRGIQQMRGGDATNKTLKTLFIR